MKNKFIVLASVIASVFSAAGNAQCNFSVVGTWKLVSVASRTDKDETKKAALGQHPSGLLTYTADDRMMVIISDDGRKPLSIPDTCALAFHPTDPASRCRRCQLSSLHDQVRWLRLQQIRNTRAALDGCRS